MPFGGILTASLIGGGSSILGGLFGKNASQNAAKVQAQAAQQVAQMAETAGNAATTGINKAVTGGNVSLGNASTILGQLFGQDTSAISPYLSAGQTGLTALQQALQPGGTLTQQFSFDPSKIAQDPGYQFQLQQGTQAIERSAAARGQALSGGTMKSLINYGQGLAGTEFQNAYNRALTTFQTNRQNFLNPLLALTSFGQTGVGQLLGATGTYGGQQLSAAQSRASLGLQGAEAAGQAGLTAAQIAGQAIAGGANAQAAGIVGGANSLNSMFGNLGNYAMQGAIYNNMLGSGQGPNYFPSSGYSPTTFAPPNSYNSSVFAAPGLGAPPTLANTTPAIPPMFNENPALPGYVSGP